MYVCTYVCMYVCMYVCTCVHALYVCIFTYIHMGFDSMVVHVFTVFCNVEPARQLV